jgi:hypothetical protein
MRPADSQLINLRSKLRKARRCPGRESAVVIAAICNARAAGLEGLRIQALTLCDILEATQPPDPRAVNLARNIRQTIMALLKPSTGKG